MGEKAVTRQCVIIGGGDIVCYASVAAEIRPSDFVICADGGYRHCALLGVEPDLLVGDFDSIGDALPEGVPLLRLPPDKDYTDTTLAIEQARELGFCEYLLTGVLGGRLDHTLANIQELCDCVKQGHQAYISDGETRVYALCAQGTTVELWLQPSPRHYFSLLAMSEQCEGVTIEGGVYPLRDYPLRHDKPRAISNEFADKPVRISLRRGTVIVTSMPVR